MSKDMLLTLLALAAAFMARWMLNSAIGRLGDHDLELPPVYILLVNFGSFLTVIIPIVAALLLLIAAYRNGPPFAKYATFFALAWLAPKVCTYFLLRFLLWRFPPMY
jgi:hypothetical protein